MNDWLPWAVIAFQAFLVVGMLIHSRSTLYLSLRDKDEVIATLVRENIRLTGEVGSATPWWPQQFPAEAPPAPQAYPYSEPAEEFEEVNKI